MGVANHPLNQHDDIAFIIRVSTSSGGQEIGFNTEECIELQRSNQKTQYNNDRRQEATCFCYICRYEQGYRQFHLVGAWAVKRSDKMVIDLRRDTPGSAAGEVQIYVVNAGQIFRTGDQISFVAVYMQQSLPLRPGEYPCEVMHPREFAPLPID